jgi:RND superfamily putative drug exporter
MMLASAGLLVALTIPFFDIQLGAAGAGTLPESTDSARAFQLLDEDFEVGLVTPVEIVVIADEVSSPEVGDAVSGLVTAMSDEEIFGPSRRETLNATTALISVPLDADAGSDAATEAVDRLRDTLVPEAFDGVEAEVLVGGIPAMNRDWFATVDTYTPIVFVFVLGLSFLLLLMAFRSIVVPLKAIVMNLLSVGAAYGLLVLVFQDGVGAGVLGFQQVESIEAWVPLFLFTVLFGLSMDYHVFLLSRIKEHFDETRDNVESVAFGIRTTGGIITGAAAIMVVVFSGFALGELVMFQQMGFGLAVAVFLDATIVRTILVPSTMRLLGDRNWYFPSWLEWVPRIQIEGPSSAVPSAEPELAHSTVGTEGGDRSA